VEQPDKRVAPRAWLRLRWLAPSDCLPSEIYPRCSAGMGNPEPCRCHQPRARRPDGHQHQRPDADPRWSDTAPITHLGCRPHWDGCRWLDCCRGHHSATALAPSPGHRWPPRRRRTVRGLRMSDSSRDDVARLHRPHGRYQPDGQPVASTATRAR
jgi:hypothetical protein